jgi:hypothetical protein
MERVGVGVIFMIVGISYRRITLTEKLMSIPQSMVFLRLLSSGKKTTSEGSISE